MNYEKVDIDIGKARLQECLNAEQMAYDLALIYAEHTFKDFGDKTSTGKFLTADSLRRRFLFAYGTLLACDRAQMIDLYAKTAADGYTFSVDEESESESNLK